MQAKANNNESANLILTGMLNKGLAAIGDNGVWTLAPHSDQPLQFDPEELSEHTVDAQHQSSLMQQ